MKPQDDIKKLYEKAAVNTNPETDKIVFNKILAVQSRTNMWKVIMKSTVFKFAAMIAIVLLAAQTFNSPKKTTNLLTTQIKEDSLAENNSAVKHNVAQDIEPNNIDQQNRSKANEAIVGNTPSNVERTDVRANRGPSDISTGQAGIIETDPVTQIVNGVQCSISIEPDEVMVGQSFIIDIDIKNISSSDITFYYQYLYKAERLVIKNEKGQVVSFSETAAYNWPNPKEFYQEIKAGKSYKQQIGGTIAFALNQNAVGEEIADRPLIIDFFDIAHKIDNAGTFTATLQLAADANTVKNGTSFGFSNIWSGKLVSNEIEFTVKPADRSFQDKMIEQLQSDDLEQVREALKVIQASADSRAIEKLMKMLAEGKQPLREVSQALIHIQDRKILPQLTDLYEDLSKKIVNDQDKRQSAVLSTIKGLETDGKKLEALYMQIINSGDSAAAQQSAISDLAMGNNPEAIPVLIQAAKNENRYIHLGAIDSLGLLGSHLEEKHKQPIIDCLVEIMRTSPISEKRQRAVQALSRLGTESVIPFMIEALKDSDSYVGVSAVFYLGTHGDLDTIEFIEQYEKRATTDRQKSAAQDAIKTIRQRKSTEN